MVLKRGYLFVIFATFCANVFWRIRGLEQSNHLSQKIAKEAKAKPWTQRAAPGTTSRQAQGSDGSQKRVSRLDPGRNDANDGIDASGATDNGGSRKAS
jgi:hypothetical protein